MNVDDIIKKVELETIGGSVSVLNNGGYVAKFKVSYQQNGKEIVINSGDFTCGVLKSIDIPSDATCIKVSAEAAIFIRSWSDIFRDEFMKPIHVSYEVYGTTLNRKWKKLT